MLMQAFVWIVLGARHADVDFKKEDMYTRCDETKTKNSA